MRFSLTGTRGSTSAVTIDGTPVPIELTDPDLNVLSVGTQPGTIGIMDNQTIAGRVGYYQDSKPVPEADLELTGDMVATVQSVADGGYTHTVLSCGDYRVTPEKGETDEDAIRAGVTMLDAGLVRRHILKKLPETLTTPYQLLAADANGSDTITTVDIRLVRQLATDIRDSFPNVDLWRFVSSDYVFPDPLHPWDPMAYREYTDLVVDRTGQDFTAIKVGDVNGSWEPAAGSGMLASGWRAGFALHDLVPPTTLRVLSRTVMPGRRVSVPVILSRTEGLTTAQFTLAWDPAVLRFASVAKFGLRGMDADAFGRRRVEEGKLSFGWDDPQAKGVDVAPGTVLFEVAFDAVGRSGDRSAVALVSRPTVQEVTMAYVVQPVRTEDGEVRVLGAPKVLLGGDGGSGRALTMRVQSLEGTRWQVEFSRDLVSWEAVEGLALTMPAGGGDEVVLPVGAGEQGFYRIVFVP